MMKPTNDLPTHIGPYRVLAPLAHSTMSVVVEAQHVDSSELAVVKVPRGDESTAQRAIEHEVAVLRGLDHPNIARLREHGASWLALERAPGAPLSLAHPGHLDDDGLRARLRPFVGLCHALAYLHGEGWVHSDLSPGNVMVSGDGASRLLDFGLATRFGHRLGTEDLERAGLLAGTLAYTSPEQLRGMPLDARSDLYALGCLLYEQVTGIPPYRGRREEIIRGHLQGRPARPPASIPRGLAQVTMRLLSRDPERRPGHAFALLEEIVACGVPALMPPRPPRAYLTQPELVGREDGIEQWERALEDEDQVQRWALVGEVGMGKSRAAFELIHRARRAGFEVLTASPEREVGGPLGVFAPWVQGARAPRDRLRRAEWVRTRLLERGRALLVFDDLDQLSEDSAFILNHLLEHPSPWILACSRDGVDADAWSHVWALQRFDGEATRALAQSALGGLALPDALDAFLSERGMGNPWLILEYMQELLDERLLTFEQGGTYRFDVPAGTLRAKLSEVEVPSALASALEARVARLPKGARDVCLWLAVAARPLPRAELERRPDLDLDGLVHAGWLVEDDEGLGLSNRALGSALLSSASPGERARWHRRMLERGDMEDAERARHLEGVGELELAARAHRVAGDLAIEAHDRNAASVHFRAARALSADPQVRFESGMSQIEHVLLPQLRYRDALDLLEELSGDLGECASRRSSARWHLMRGILLGRNRLLDEAFAALDRCESLIDPEDRLLLARQHKVRADLFGFVGRQRDALESYGAAIEVCRECDGSDVLGRALYSRAGISRVLDSPEAALEELKEAIEAFESAGRPDLAALVDNALAEILSTLWRFDEALESTRRLLEVQRRLGSYALETGSQVVEATCLSMSGRLAKAERLFRAIVARCEPYTTSLSSGVAHFRLCLIACERLDLGGARERLELLAGFETIVDAYISHAVLDCTRAYMMALEGDLDEALATVTSAHQRLEELALPYLDVFEHAFLEAQVLYLCGAHERMLEFAEARIAEFEDGGARNRALLFRWLVALVRFTRGELEDAELDAMRALGGHNIVMDTRVRLLTARVRLERGERAEARELMDLAHEVCERERLVLEQMTLWRLEVMVAPLEGEDPAGAREELEDLRRSAPPGLPERAWWPRAPKV